MTSAADCSRGDTNICLCGRAKGLGPFKTFFVGAKKAEPKPVSRARIISSVNGNGRQVFLVQEKVSFLRFWSRWRTVGPSDYQEYHSDLENAKCALRFLKHDFECRGEAKANKGKVIVEE